MRLVGLYAPRVGRHVSEKAAKRQLRRTLRRHTAVAWVWLFAMFTIWSLATPLWGSPDSPAHELMSYHAVRDVIPENTNEFASGVTSNAIVKTPAGLRRSAESMTCYALDPNTSADCLRPVEDDSTSTDYVNPAGRNLPSYYLATGWPSLIVPLDWVVFADRLAASALAAFFIAWAVSALTVGTRRRSVALTGLIVAFTPMVAFLGGALNPNTLEIAAGMAIAASTVVFLREGGDTWLGQAMFKRLMTAVAVMCLIRMLAPVWALVWAVVFVLLAERRHWQHVLSHRALAWVAVPAAACVVNVVWTFTSGLLEFQAEPKHDLGLLERLQSAKSHQDITTLHHQIGNFGWLTTPLTPGLYLIYTVCALILLGLFVTVLRRREIIAIGALCVLQYLVPIVLEAAQWNTNGAVWQGRYTLPMTVMIPILTLGLAATRIDTDSARALVKNLHWVAPVLIAGLLAVHLQAMVIQLRRNIDGFTGSLWADGGWTPPLGTLPVLTLQFIAVAALFALVVWWYRRDHHTLDLPRPAGPSTDQRVDPAGLNEGSEAGSR